MNTLIKHLLVLVSLLCLFSCSPNPDSGLKERQNYTISDNISNHHITSIAEDAEGYIWMGTNRGLNRFNGYEYRQFFKDPDDTRSVCDNRINALFRDSRNQLWIATESGISLMRNGTDFETIAIENDNSYPVQIVESQDGEVIINLRSHLCQYDSVTNTFRKFYTFEQYNISNKCLIDRNNRLWAIGINSVQCLDMATLKPIKRFDVGRMVNLFYAYMLGDMLFVEHGKGDMKVINVNTLEPEIIAPLQTHPVLSQALITIVHPYSPTGILFNTHKNGLYLCDSENNRLIHQSEKDFPFEVPKAEITTLFTDTQGNLWIGTLTQQIKVVYKYSQQFNTNATLHNLLENQSITALATDNRDNLWIATYSDNLYIYNLATDNVVHIDLKKFFLEDPYFQDKISSIHIDADNVVWIQSDAKLTQCSYIDGKLTRLFAFNERIRTYDLAEDRNGTKWIGTRENYVCAARKGTTTYQRVELFADNHNNHRNVLLALTSGKILVASSNHYLHIIDPDTWTTEQFSLKDAIAEQDFVPTALYEDSHKNIWIGIVGQGLYKYSFADGRTEKIDGIPCKDISSIIEDSDGNLWIGTLYGLSKYDVTEKQFFTFYSYDGIGGNQFNRKSAIRLSNGNLIFGGTHGLTIFDPTIINMQRQIPLYFEEIKPYVSLPESKKVNLPHNDTDLSISFVALDYSRYPRVRYYYKMEGVDNDWINARNNRQVSYSNLRPGNYRFSVYVSANDNTTVLARNSFDIHVSPSPWLSTWALVLYGVFIIGVLVYINNLYLRIRNSKNLAQIALREKEHEKHINQMNMSFFANISHEFRTPLTLIAGPVATILRNESLDPKNRQLLLIVNRSINRMLRLVNQILSFHKLENDALSLRLNRVDIVHEINEIIEVFQANDNSKNLQITTSGLERSYFMLFDKDKLEKILINILSNAFKFSPQNGTIRIHFDVVSRHQAEQLIVPGDKESYKEANYIVLSVEDEGRGVPENKLDNIFRKYYQVDHGSSTGGYNWGTGIGLYFTKRLVTMHHGFIKAANRKEGGAVFTVVIPVEESQAGANPQPETTEMQQPMVAKQDNPHTTPEIRKPDESKYTILVIDDDTEISAWLHTLLSEDYNVVNKYSTDSAFDSLDETAPDLIVSDVIMPGTSGYEFCRKMKTSEEYSHIPIVLLTAKSSVDEQIEGLEIGANAYIPKPFDPNYLMAVIKSQLMNLHHIRNLLGSSTAIPKSENTLTANDSRLMNRLYELMEKELSNSELNISEITKIIGMSRTKFYHKIKGLTGENPNVFFRKYKLNRAAELIRTGEYTISEVADITGFTTLSHFSVSFKKQFGVSPKEYK